MSAIETAEATAVQQLAAFAAATTYDSLPSDVVASVRARTLDLLGLCLAAGELPSSVAAVDFARSEAGGDATIVGFGDRTSARSAAFANGVLAHSLDYDDTHLPSVLHPSAPVLPAVWAVAQRVGASGAQVIAATAVGLEICCRLGMAGYDRAAGNSVFFDRGQHATSICGTLAAAAAAAHVQGADVATIADAMGIAASMGAGIIEANRTGGTVKRIHCGWAAQSGVSAADLAILGITGPPTVLEGRFGFFQAHIGDFLNEAALLDGLGADWAVPGIFFKPYPANHFTHAIIDATLEARRKGITSDDIVSVHVAVADPTVRTVGEPIEVKRRPKTGYQAQFSAPYMVAAVLEGGSGLGLGLSDFTDEHATDPRRRAIMEKVTVGSDPRCDAIFPDGFPAIVTFTTSEGVFEIERLVNRGGPAMPLTDDELALKFSDNGSKVLARAEVDAVVACVGELDTLAVFGDLVDLTAATQPQPNLLSE